MSILPKRIPGKVSASAALEILGFLASQSRNIQYDPESDELIVNGVGFREAMLVKASLSALGAGKESFEDNDPDDGLIILCSARAVARKLAAEGIEFAGRAQLPAAPRRR